MGYKSKERYEQTDLSDIASRFHDFEMDSSEKIVQQLEFERMRYNFLAEGSRNIVFTFIPFHRRYSLLTRLAVNEAGLQNLHFSPLQSGVLKDLVEEQSLETAYPEDYPGHRTGNAGRDKQSFFLTDGKNPLPLPVQMQGNLD